MRVRSLHVYPVKGCRGLACEEALLGPLGFEHDRRFAFATADGIALTQRDQPLLATIVPSVEARALRLDLGGLAQVELPFEAFTEAALVDVWGKPTPGRAVPIPDRVTDYLGVEARLVMLEPGAERSFADSRPVLVATTAGLAALGLPQIGMERFRPNLVLEGGGEWRELRTRECVLEFSKPCGRCEVTTIDQESGARTGPEPLRTLTERFAGNFGRYFRVARGGRLRRGEALQAA
ncbi:MAG TPA: MOSC N-terminal beta barrel domain-containing protein [Burkholderiales bacterium]